MPETLTQFCYYSFMRIQALRLYPWPREYSSIAKPNYACFLVNFNLGYFHSEKGEIEGEKDQHLAQAYHECVQLLLVLLQKNIRNCSSSTLTSSKGRTTAAAQLFIPLSLSSLVFSLSLRSLSKKNDIISFFLLLTLILFVIY